MDQALQASQKPDRRGSLAPSCRFHRAGTTGFLHPLYSMTAQFYLASHRYRYDGDREFQLRHVRRPAPYARTHDQLPWQSIHPVKFYQHLEDQPSIESGHAIFSHVTELRDIPQYDL